MKRRDFIAASIATALTTSSGWSAAGEPDFVTAANLPDRSSWLVGLKLQTTLDAKVTFRIPLPGRGHAATPHPHRAEAVAFARRPGRFAVVMDCTNAQERLRLTSPPGRHFYGHGAFSSDGTRLFTTENNYDDLTGVIGIYDAENNYVRLGELPSGGIGPHEILRRPDGGFVVANGGIQTHPDMARAKLNIPTMRPTLVYLNDAGEIEEDVGLPDEMHKNSIRHIDISGDGNVLIALQWQGNPLADVPMMARHRRGEPITFLPHPKTAQLKNYAGSISCAPKDQGFSVTGPKGNVVLHFDAAGHPAGSSTLPTASGIARAGDAGLVITCDGGLVLRRAGQDRFLPIEGNWAWDNHLTAI